MVADEDAAQDAACDAQVRLADGLRGRDDPHALRPHEEVERALGRGCERLTPAPEQDLAVAVARGGERVHPADEFGDEACRGTLVDVLGGADLGDAAAVHHRDAVAHRQRLDLVMGDEEGGDAERALDRADLVAHRVAQLGVEIGEGFVEQQDGGADHQRAGESDALLLAAGELARAPLAEMAELDHGEPLRDLTGDLGPGDAALLQPEGDVAGDGEMRKQRVGLEDVAHVALMRRQPGDLGAVDADRAAVGSDQPGQHAQGRGLAASGGAEQGDGFALRDRQRDVVDRDGGAVALLQAGQFEIAHDPDIPG